MEKIVNINNFKEFHQDLIDLEFTYVNLAEIYPDTDFPWIDYFILLRDNGKTRFRLGISIKLDRGTITTSVMKQRLPDLKTLERPIKDIEGEISFDKIVKLKERFS